MIENILLVLAVLLFSAKIFGEIAERLNFSSLVGQIFAGIIVGPVFGLAVRGNSTLSDLITLFVIFVLFLAGLGVRFEDIKEHIYFAATLASLGGLLSFFLGFLVGYLFFHSTIVGFAIGTAILSSSDIIMFSFLEKMKMMHTKLGKVIIATTIADDVVGIIFLSILLGYIKSQTFQTSAIFTLFLVSIGFYFVMFTVGTRIVHIIMSILTRFRDETIFFAIPAGIALMVGYMTENIGIGMAVGAFITGMAVANSHLSENIVVPHVRMVSKSLFEPILYSFVGASLILSNLNVLLIIAIFAAASLGKIVGIGFLSRFFGIDRKSSSIFGMLMVPRGNDNIALVEIIFITGAITLEVYSSVIFAMILTIIATPLLIRLAQR